MISIHFPKCLVSPDCDTDGCEFSADLIFIVSREKRKKKQDWSNFFYQSLIPKERATHSYQHVTKCLTNILPTLSNSVYGSRLSRSLFFHRKTSCRTWQTTGVAVSNKNVSDKQKVNVNSPVMNPKHPENTFDQLLLRSLGKNNRYS